MRGGLSSLSHSSFSGLFFTAPRRAHNRPTTAPRRLSRPPQRKKRVYRCLAAVDPLFTMLKLFCFFDEFKSLCAEKTCHMWCFIGMNDHLDAPDFARHVQGKAIAFDLESVEVIVTVDA